MRSRHFFRRIVLARESQQDVEPGHMLVRVTADRVHVTLISVPAPPSKPSPVGNKSRNQGARAEGRSRDSPPKKLRRAAALVRIKVGRRGEALERRRRNVRSFEGDFGAAALDDAFSALEEEDVAGDD